jgi:hypothetical protein
MVEGDERPRAIGEFADYSGMVAVIRNRVSELQIQGERFEHFAGLPTGYLSKLVGVRPVRRISMVSMGPLFLALGIRCIIVEDPAATARLKNRIRPRNNSYMRASYTHLAITNRQWSRIQKLGRAARWKRLSRVERADIMRAIALKRWRG